MTPPDAIKLDHHVAQARGIIRHYAIVNGFDGALTMSGLLIGFMLGAVLTAFACVYALGAFLGAVAGTCCSFSGLEALLIALATMLLVLA